MLSLFTLPKSPPESYQPKFLSPMWAIPCITRCIGTGLVMNTFGPNLTLCTLLDPIQNFSNSLLRELHIFYLINYYDKFHFCLFNFPFNYHFYSIMTTWVKSTCQNPADLFIFKSFCQHFNLFDKECYLKEKWIFCSYL